MLQKMTDLPHGLDGIRAVGEVTRDDYEQVFEPILEQARRQGRHLRFLYEIGPEFERFTPGAAWQDAKLGLRSMRLFDGCAIVTDHDWLRRMTHLLGFLMPCPVRVFPGTERDQAVAWLASLHEGAAGRTHSSV